MSVTEPSPTATRSTSPAGGALPRSTPEQQGVPSDAVLRMVRRWEDEGNEPHGVLVIRHGQVVAEGAWQPWPRDGIRLVYSVSKTFLAIAAAFAEAEGLLARGERLVDVFPEAAFAAGPRAARLTIEDCLRMSTGHHTDSLDSVPGLAGGGEESVALFLATEPEEEPGSWFLYHNGASRVLALAVQRRTGMRLVDYLGPRLLDPLGVDDAVWTTWAGSDLGFSGLHVTTETVARLGLLLLQDGAWEGAQVLPAGWVSTASSALADTSHHPGTSDWLAGYGYQMWRCHPDGFRADGAYGQFALVLPHLDLVVTVTACTEDTQEVLDAVWEELLPHLGETPLPADPVAQERLRSALDAATTPARRSTTTAPATDGPWTYSHTPSPEHPALRSVVVHRAGDGWLLEVDDGELLRIACGDGRWPDAGAAPWVASGGWVAPGVFEATVIAHETPHSLLLRCADGAVTASWRGVPLHGPGLARVRAPRG
ncbi:MAG TPA: serine hydrolase domain-containing protein [Ornithinibacter sp.]|nr:serine hydrolase domain-containing protein [Ornithinibacter sp.]